MVLTVLLVTVADSKAALLAVGHVGTRVVLVVTGPVGSRLEVGLAQQRR